jgi:hypothetical protein
LFSIYGILKVLNKCVEWKKEQMRTIFWKESFNFFLFLVVLALATQVFYWKESFKFETTTGFPIDYHHHNLFPNIIWEKNKWEREGKKGKGTEKRRGGETLFLWLTYPSPAS